MKVIYDSQALPVLLQLFVILLVCMLCSLLAQYVRQTTFCFKLLGGIIVGPSVLGRFETTIFPSSSIMGIHVSSDFGLLLHTFVVGLEIDIALTKSTIIPVSVMTLMGMVMSHFWFLWMTMITFVYVETQALNWATFKAYLVLVSTSIANISVNVTVNMLKENRIFHTKVGNIALGIAKVNSVIIWVMIVVGASFIHHSTYYSIAWPLITALVQAILIVTVLNKAVRYVIYWFEDHYHQDGAMEVELSVILITLMLIAFVNAHCGIEPAIGTMLFGVTIPRRSRVHGKLIECLELFINSFFLPIYAVYVGLRIDLNALLLWPDLLITVCMIFFALLSKYMGTGLAGLCCRLSMRESMTIASLTNARGVGGLLVLQIGLENNIINTRSFTMLGITCLATTLFTDVVVKLIHPYKVRKRRSSGAGRLEEQLHQQLEEFRFPEEDASDLGSAFELDARPVEAGESQCQMSIGILPEPTTHDESCFAIFEDNFFDEDALQPPGLTESKQSAGGDEEGLCGTEAPTNELSLEPKFFTDQCHEEGFSTTTTAVATSRIESSDAFPRYFKLTRDESGKALSTAASSGRMDSRNDLALSGYVRCSIADLSPYVKEELELDESSRASEQHT